MFSTFNDFTALMKRLRECVPLFVSSTIVTALAQISVVGVSVTSVWVSTRFILDPAHDLTPLVTLLFTLVVVHAEIGRAHV